MSNFNIQITGSANLKQVQSQFKLLEEQIAALNTEMKRTVQQSRLATNPKQYAAMNRSVAANSQVFRDAAESTGLYRAEQLRINSATEEYTKALQRQKVSFRDWYKSRKVANSAFREQLALQNMVVRQLPTTKNGKSMFDVVVPKEVSKDLNTASQRLGFFREQLKSASTQLVNWGKNTQWAGRQLMVGFTVPIAAFGAGTAKLAYDVDKQMTRVQKVYNTTAQQFSADANEQKKAQAELDDLRAKSTKNAIKASQLYGTSMSDTLGVEAELAAVGLKGNNLLGQTTEVVKNATLGEIDYATATKATVGMQQILHLSQKKTSDNWAYMNSVENATSLSMKDFATAIPIALGPLKQMGGDVQTLGTLLTGMVSRGIAVGKAANGIKAAAQRLLRPSKQVRKEFTALTGADIAAIGQKNKGNLLGMLKDIYAVTKDLNQFKRGKVLAGLFGSNQLATMSAMVDSMGDLEKGVGQVSTAYNIGNQSVETWRKVQDKELNQWRKSVSGQFKIALESLKSGLVEMGQPFLQVGTTVLGVLARIVKAFNNLPSVVKKGFAIAAIIAAVIGPVVMLTGLFANMIGTTLKFGVALVGLGTKFELLDKESAAARLASKLASVGFDNEATAAQNAALMVDKLASSLRASAAAQRQSMAASAMLAPTSGRWGKASGQLNTSVARSGVYWENPSDRTSQIVRRTTGQKTPNVNTWETQDKVVSSQVEKSTQGISKNMKLAAASGTVMSGAMLASMVSSNHTVSSLANIAMISALVGPALSGGFGLAKRGAEKLLPTIKRLRGEAYLFAAAFSEAPLAKAAGLIRVMAVAGAEALGPMTAVIAAAGVAAYGMYRMWKKEKQIAQEQKETQEAINNSTKTWADILGVVQKRYQGISLASPTSQKGAPTTGEQAQKFLDSPTGHKIADAYVDGTPDQKAFIAQKMYIDLLTKTNATAKQAQHGLEVMFTAAGDGAMEAQRKAFVLASTLGKSISANEMKNLWTQQISLAWKGTDAELQPRAKELGKSLAMTIANASTQAGKEGALNGFMSSVADGWSGMLRSEVAPRIKRELAQIGITSGAQLKSFYSGKNVSGVDTGKQDKLRLMLYSQIGDHAERINKIEHSVVGELAKQLGVSAKINTMSQLRETWEWKVYAVSRKNAKALYDQRIQAMKMAAATSAIASGLLGNADANGKVSRSQRLQVLNQILVNKGLGQAKTLQQGFAMLAGKSADAQSGVSGAVKGTVNSMGMLVAAARKVDLGGLMKDTMSGIESGIADQTSADFDSRMNASLAATQAAGQRRMDALSARQEAASNALQARQERASNAMEARHQKQSDSLDAHFQHREKAISGAYDKRIKNVQREINAEKKADDIRQKLFAAEMARMDRLNEAANRNIDFNAALNSGNFDEAAKIRNDANAAADKFSLQDALDKSSSKSQSKQDKMQKRIDSLENVKQKRLDNLHEIEDAEKKALERRQQRESQALAAQQKREENAMKKHQDRVQKGLQREVDMNNNSAQKMWDDRKAYLAKALEDFTGYTAMSSKDLLKHIKNWQKKYGGLNLSTKKMFNLTAKDINKYLVKQMSDSRQKIVNSSAWDTFGDKIASKMIRGAFNMNKDQFFKWLAGGKPPKSAGSGGSKKKAKGDTASRRRVASAQGNKNRAQFRHTGGKIDDSPGSRKGVARSTVGLASNERNIISKLGEYMVNDKAVSKYGTDSMDAVNLGKAAIITPKQIAEFSKLKNPENSAKVPSGRRTMENAKPNTGGAGTAYSSIMAAGIAQATKSAINGEIMAAGLAARARDIAMASLGGGLYGAGAAGNYGGRNYGTQQMRNAAIIASVGSSMGMSKRDIEIGIMTAITESGLINLHRGDRDSQGLFQQRPSQGWGSVAQVTNPKYAARKFFSVLKGVGGRAGLSPWAAAQRVQRSAYSDGRNYHPYWDDSIGIFNHLKKLSSGGGGGYVAGPGGIHRPVRGGHLSQGIHDVSTGFPAVDIGVPTGTPVYAAHDGKVVISKDLRGNDGRVSNGGYYSYGRYIQIAGGGGRATLYAHLSRRGVHAGQTVKGGSRIGFSGNTGHSFGDHLHFGAHNPGPMTYLKKGGHTKTDGRASLHQDEVVIDPARTAKLYDGLDTFTNQMSEVQNRKWSVTQENVRSRSNSSGNNNGVTGSSVKGTGNRASVRTGTFNLFKDNSAKGQRQDMARIMPHADVLSLTEYEKVARHGGLAKWIRSKGWGVYAAHGGGDYADTAVASTLR